MYLKEQHYVCTLADTGSITSAAQKLFISQPALSTYIKSLEGRMGGALFFRKDGVYHPTYLGEIYLQRARKMLAMQDAFNLERGLILDGVKGRIRIGVQTRRSPMVICPIFCLLRDRYPNIEPIIEEGNDSKLRNMLRENRIDLMISSMDELDHEFCYQTISQEVLLLAARADGVVASKAQQRPGEKYPVVDLFAAQDETFILPHQDQSLRATCQRLFDQKGFQPSRHIQIRSIESAMCLVEKGFGVGFNRSSYAEFMPVSDSLLYLRVEGYNHSSQLIIGYDKDNQSISAFRAFLDHLLHALRAALPEKHNEKLF